MFHNVYAGDIAMFSELMALSHSFIVNNANVQYFLIAALKIFILLYCDVYWNTASTENNMHTPIYSLTLLPAILYNA